MEILPCEYCGDKNVTASCAACYSFFCRHHWSPEELAKHLPHMKPLSVSPTKIEKKKR